MRPHGRHRFLTEVLKYSGVAGLMILWGCGGTTDSTQPPAGPQLSLSTNLIDFGAAGGERSLTIENTGSATLTWSITDQPAWIQTDPSSGALASGEEDTISIVALRNLLTPGENEDYLTVSSNAGSTEIIVQATLSEEPVLGELPAELNFGVSSDSLPLQIINAGQDTLTWNLSDGSPYFSAAVDSGLTMTQSQIWIRFDRDNAPVGNWQAPLLANSNGGNAQVNLQAYSGSFETTWLSNCGAADSYYNPTYLDWFFVVCFERPPGWEAFSITGIRTELYTQAGAYDDIRLYCWDVFEESGVLFPDISNSGTNYQTAPFDALSGIREWTVNWLMNQQTFCVGYYQEDYVAPIWPKPYYDATSSAGHSYQIWEYSYGYFAVDLLADWEWRLEVRVEPEPTFAGSQNPFIAGAGLITSRQIPENALWLRPVKIARSASTTAVVMDCKSRLLITPTGERIKQEESP